MFLVFMLLNKNTSSFNNLTFLFYNPLLNIKNKFFNFIIFQFNLKPFFNNFIFFIKLPIIKKLKKFNNFKNFFYLNKLTFSFKFLFNKLFKTTIIKKKFKTKNTISSYFIKNKYHLLLKNWSHTINGPISPYFWDLYAKKKWIRKFLNPIFLKNSRFFFSNKQNSISLKNKTTIKKLFYHNFYYLNKTNLNYSNFNLLFYTKYKKNLRNTNDWFLSKPHTFLNTFPGFKFSTYFANYTVIKFFKTYSRIFNFFKRFNYSLKFKKTINPVFKNIFSKKLLFNKKKNKTSKIYKPYTHFKNNLIIFLFKSDNIKIWNNKIKKIKRKKMFKKFFLLSWFKAIKRKFKINKKNKLFIKLKKKFYIKNKFLILKKNNRFSWKLRKLSLISYLNNKNYTHKQGLKKFKFKFKKKSPFIKTNPLIKFIKKSIFLNSIRYKLYSFKILSKFSKNKIPHFLKPIFKNKYKVNFLNNNYGFLFLNNFQINYLKLTNNFNNLKKHLYLFSYKNDLKKFILKRYSKFNNYFNNTKNFKNSNINYNLNTSIKSQSFLNTFFIFKNTLTLLNETNYFSNKNWNRYSQEITYWKNSENESSEFNIKRIRFKPGYMKMWRESRKSLQTTLSINFKYQHRLTKYLSKFHKFIKFRTFLICEMTLINILIKSRILTETSLINFLISNNLVYVNGFLNNQSNRQLFVGDFIQLILNLKYYIIFKWLFNLSIKKKNRLKNISRKKYTPFSINNDKKRSYNLPKWILFSKNSYNDVSKFLEVDYFTLSIFIIYEPFLWSDLNIYNIIDNKFSIINIYNWKYIN